MRYIQSINWAFTYQCNLKCTHCDIWSNPHKKAMPLSMIDKILESKILQESYAHYGDYFDIAVSGGEALLIHNLKEIMEHIDDAFPGSIHSISTNGILKKQIIELLIFWKKKGKSLRKINISIDGKEETHDLQRGIQGSFKKSIETIQTIKKLFPEQIIEIKLTITKYNYHDILFISQLADKLGIFFSFKPAENMSNYTNQNGEIDIKFSKEEIDTIEKQILNNSAILKQNFYIHKNFFYSIPNYLRNGLGEGKKMCTIAENSVNIMPDGKVYSCILMEKIGDFNSESLDEIWNGQLIEQQREKIKKSLCPGCMLMCGSFKSKNLYANE